MCLSYQTALPGHRSGSSLTPSSSRGRDGSHDAPTISSEPDQTSTPAQTSPGYTHIRFRNSFDQGKNGEPRINRKVCPQYRPLLVSFRPLFKTLIRKYPSSARRAYEVQLNHLTFEISTAPTQNFKSAYFQFHHVSLSNLRSPHCLTNVYVLHKHRPTCHAISIHRTVTD